MAEPRLTATWSTMIRAGKTTYFVDMKEAKDEKKYLVITENVIDKGEGKRTKIVVKADCVGEFLKAVQDAVGYQA